MLPAIAPAAFSAAAARPLAPPPLAPPPLQDMPSCAARREHKRLRAKIWSVGDPYTAGPYALARGRARAPPCLLPRTRASLLLLIRGPAPLSPGTPRDDTPLCVKIFWIARPRPRARPAAPPCLLPRTRASLLLIRRARSSLAGHTAHACSLAPSLELSVGERASVRGRAERPTHTLIVLTNLCRALSGGPLESSHALVLTQGRRLLGTPAGCGPMNRSCCTRKTTASARYGEEVVAGAAHTGLKGWRLNMEDEVVAELLGPHLGVFAVMDGHGGAFCSRWAAAELAPRLSPLGERVHAASDADEPRQVAQHLSEAVRQMDCDLRTRGRPAWSCGTTLVTLLVTRRSLTVANLGDSRAVLCRAGTALPLSRDHKPKNASELQRIVGAGGFVVDGRVNGDLSLSRALGDFRHKCVPELPPAKQPVSSEPEARRGADTFQPSGSARAARSARSARSARLHCAPRPEPLSAGAHQASTAAHNCNDMLAGAHHAPPGLRRLRAARMRRSVGCALLRGGHCLRCALL